MLGRRHRERRGPDLRARTFEVDPREIGCGPDGERQVWGVVVDIALDEGVATVVSLVDGTTSLYTTTGGGVVGGDAAEPVAQASEALVWAVERDLDRFSPATGTAPPKAGYVRFWALTYGGVRMAEAHAEDLERGHPLWQVHVGSQGVFTAIREHAG